ncbi:MAG: molybdopterin/thiamine biosynthesis adenylyltransferase [Pseudohongiellaceae bacterium]|jgi:molybdopterin/thiamine biosynthesis adenylyltransferase
MKDDQLLRYSRQIMLPDMDIAGQQKLIDSSVLIVGLGGLGSPAAMYLAAAGVGKLIVADDDVVEVSNLQRQIAHSQESVGVSKVESGRQRLLGLNPDLEVVALNTRLQGTELDSAVEQADLVIDACDNYATRFAINQSCIKYLTPLVSGAAIRMEGQVTVFNSAEPSSPCYRCLYSEGDGEDTSCATNGVMSPVVGMIGTVQAMEAIKVLTGIGQPLLGRLLLLDAKSMQWREMKLARDPACPACSNV